MLVIRWYVWTFAAALTGVIVIVNLGKAPTVFPFLKLIPWVDKIGHFLLMGILSFLLNINLSAQRIRILFITVLKGTAIVLFLVTLEECSQMFLRYRSFSLYDLGYSFAGIILFGMIASMVVARNKPHTA